MNAYINDLFWPINPFNFFSLFHWFFAVGKKKKKTAENLQRPLHRYILFPDLHNNSWTHLCILKNFLVICMSFLPVNYFKINESDCNQNDIVRCTRAGASLVTALQSYGILLWETSGLWFMNEDSLKKHQYYPALICWEAT